MRYAATIIADASYCDQSRACGYAYWVASFRKRYGDTGRVLDGVDSNNSAELLALMRGLHDALVKKTVIEGEAVLLQSDCSAAIQAIEGQRDPVNFTPQERRLLDWLWMTCAKFDLTVHTRHVKGHTNGSKFKGARYVTNRLCDKRARKELRHARSELARDKFMREVQLDG